MGQNNKFDTLFGLITFGESTFCDEYMQAAAAINNEKQKMKS